MKAPTPARDGVIRKCPEWCEGDTCPLCKTPVRKVYTFGGGTGDAEVTVFKGCNHAIAQQYDPVGFFQYDPVLCRDYPTASGIARLAKAMQAHLHTDL